ncbi:unnamed protein product [Durusdinium trenchii]|uniref:Uncharacterized protein n=1 Tax=Durusdinium trenchii TaxID=1381693 RepID=A0ABP0I9I2_9DINO
MLHMYFIDYIVLSPSTANKVLQEELDWSVSRPSSRANGQSLNISDKQAFIKSLTANEYDFYLKYRSLAPRGLYSLNQNPRVRGMKSKLNQDMSTLIKSGTLWFSDYHSRWLSAMEALTCQGFPVHAKWSYGEPCCSFAMRNLGLSTAPLPGRSAIIGQAGNSTHTSISLHPYILPHGDQD